MLRGYLHDTWFYNDISMTGNTEPLNLKRRLKNFIVTRNEFDQNDLKQEFKDDKPKLLPFLQSLVHSQRLQICKKSDGSLLWKVKSKDHARKYQGLKKEHMLVLQEIKKTGSKGISSTLIKIRTKLAPIVQRQALVLLQKRQLIKAVKDVTSKRKKVYMIFEVIPDTKVTGGIWYNERGEFDEEFISCICTWTVGMIKQHSCLTIKELTSMLKKSNLSRVHIKERDFLRIVNKLRYENEIEIFNDPNDSSEPVNEYHKKWKIVNKFIVDNSLVLTPCGNCPVFSKCSIGGVISPETCVYMDSWLGSRDLIF